MSRGPDSNGYSHPDLRLLNSLDGLPYLDHTDDLACQLDSGGAHQSQEEGHRRVFHWDFNGIEPSRTSFQPTCLLRNRPRSIPRTVPARIWTYICDRKSTGTAKLPIDHYLSTMLSSSQCQDQVVQGYISCSSRTFQDHDISQAEPTTVPVSEPVQEMQSVAGIQGPHEFPAQPPNADALYFQLASWIGSLSPVEAAVARKLLHDRAASSEVTRSTNYQAGMATIAEESSLPVPTWGELIPLRPRVQDPIAFESVSRSNWSAHEQLQIPAVVGGDAALADLPHPSTYGYDCAGIPVVTPSGTQSVPGPSCHKLSDCGSTQANEASGPRQDNPAELGLWNGPLLRAVRDTGGGGAAWLDSTVPGQASAMEVSQSGTSENPAIAVQPPM